MPRAAYVRAFGDSRHHHARLSRESGERSPSTLGGRHAATGGKVPRRPSRDLGAEQPVMVRSRVAEPCRGVPAIWLRRARPRRGLRYRGSPRPPAGSGRVDVLAHLDVIKVAGHRPTDLAAFESRLCEAIVNAGVVVEVSTAGWRKPANELYPFPTLLEAMHRSGVSFSTASDAHALDQIGYRFEELRSILSNLGVTTLTTFKRRQPSAVPIG